MFEKIRVVESGWRKSRDEPLLPDVFRTNAVKPGATPWRKLLAFFGSGNLVAVGYIDPSN